MLRLILLSCATCWLQVKVQALDFSHDERYLASLGGQDDNAIVLWDVDTGKAICGSPAHTNFSLTVKFYHNRNDKLITAGHYNLLTWEYDLPNNKLRKQEAQLGLLQRIVKTITIDQDDEYVYCGTTSGDVLQVALSTFLFKNQGPGKEPMQLGATATCAAPNGDMLVGGGDGTLVAMRTVSEPLPSNPRMLKRLAKLGSVKLEGTVTSISFDQSSGRSFVFYVGTSACNIYKVTYEPLSSK